MQEQKAVLIISRPRPCYNFLMEWKFSPLWLLIGIIVMALGIAIIVFYNKIADNLFNGVSDYEKTKRYGLIAIVVGLILMTNTHTTILYWLLSFVFKR